MIFTNYFGEQRSFGIDPDHDKLGALRVWLPPCAVAVVLWRYPRISPWFESDRGLGSADVLRGSSWQLLAGRGCAAFVRLR